MRVDARSRRFRHRTWSFGQACSSCQRNRVLQSAKPKEARAFGIREPRSHQEKASPIRDNLDGVVGRELTVVLYKYFPASLTKKENLKSGEGRSMERELIDRAGWTQLRGRQHQMSLICRAPGREEMQERRPFVNASDLLEVA
jgi:hypothetical protein